MSTKRNSVARQERKRRDAHDTITKRLPKLVIKLKKRAEKQGTWVEVYVPGWLSRRIVKHSIGMAWLNEEILKVPDGEHVRLEIAHNDDTGYRERLDRLTYIP